MESELVFRVLVVFGQGGRATAQRGHGSMSAAENSRHGTGVVAQQGKYFCRIESEAARQLSS